MLKLIAILINVVVFGIVVMMVSDNGGLPTKGDEQLALSLMIVFPAVNLWYIRSSNTSAQSGDDENILILWLRVKKLELRKRLETPC